MFESNQYGSEECFTERKNTYKYFGNTMNVNMLSRVMSTRIVVFSNRKVSTVVERLSVQCIKSCTGGDVSEYGEVSMTMVMFSNRLHRYEDMHEYTRSDRVRKIVVVPTEKVRTVPNASVIPDSDADLKPLITRSIAMRAEYDEKAPLSIYGLMCTLFLDLADDAYKVVEPMEDASFLTAFVEIQALEY